jgi:hypothetical protein
MHTTIPPLPLLLLLLLLLLRLLLPVSWRCGGVCFSGLSVPPAPACNLCAAARCLKSVLPG